MGNGKRKKAGEVEPAADAAGAGPNVEELAGKVAAVGREGAKLFGGLWRIHSVDIQRKLLEVVEEAQREKKAVRFAVPVKVVMDLEKDEVVVTLAWSGPKKKRSVKVALSEIEPLLPGMGDEEEEG
jgi:hypothetical protein